MIVAEPPKPVRPFRDVEFIPGLFQNRRVRVALPQMLAGALDSVPTEIVFLMANPNREVVADPATREEVRQRVARRMLGEMVVDAHRANAGCVRAALVEGTQEIDAAVGIMLPA